jgi:hypothetical protein
MRYGKPLRRIGRRLVNDIEAAIESSASDQIDALGRLFQHVYASDWVKAGRTPYLSSTESRCWRCVAQRQGEIAKHQPTELSVDYRFPDKSETIQKGLLFMRQPELATWRRRVVHRAPSCAVLSIGLEFLDAVPGKVHDLVQFDLL